jgi:thioredoxin reductase (NADPH)
MGDEEGISGRSSPRPGKSWAEAPTSQLLADDHIAVLRRIGEVRPTQAGDVLFREGGREYDFFAILSGRVKLCDHQAGVQRDLVTWGARDFIAGLGLFTGERLFATGAVVEPGEVLAVPADKLQRLISRDQVLGDLIVRTMVARRNWLLTARAGLRIIGSRSQPDTRRLLEFTARNRLPHVWLDIDTDSGGGNARRRDAAQAVQR